MAETDPGVGPNGYFNPCVTCGARPFQQCRSLSRGRKTDTHAARVRGDWPIDTQPDEDAS